MSDKFRKSLREAIIAARALADIYDQIQSAPGNFAKRGISEEAGWARRWLEILESDPSPDDVDQVWREVQQSGRILDGIWEPTTLSKTKDLLLDDLFQAVLDLTAEARRLRQ